MNRPNGVYFTTQDLHDDTVRGSEASGQPGTVDGAKCEAASAGRITIQTRRIFGGCSERRKRENTAAR